MLLVIFSESTYDRHEESINGIENPSEYYLKLSSGTDLRVAVFAPGVIFSQLHFSVMTFSRITSNLISLRN